MKSIDYGSGKITSLYIKILIPTLVGMMFSAVFGLTDGIFVGHGVGSDGLAAVNLVMPVFTLATGLGVMFGTGVSVLAAICLAREQVDDARAIVTQALAFTLLIGLLLAAFLYAFPMKMMSLFGVSERLLPLCMDYYLWFVPFPLLIMVQIVMQFVVRLDGDPGFAGLMEVVPACFNIFLDWLFIFPLHLGLMGAALATSLGGIVGLVMGGWYMLKRCKTLRICRLGKDIKASAANIMDMAKVGFPGFIGEFSVSIMMLAGNYAYMKMLGEDGVAAFSVTCYIAPVVVMVFIALSQSAQPIISFNFGKGNRNRVKKALNLSIASSCALGVIMTLFFSFCTDASISAFLKQDNAAFRICTSGFPIYACSFPFMAISMSMIGYYQSIKKSTRSTIFNFLRGIAFPVAAFAVLPRIFGETGLWLSVPVSECLTALLIGISAIWTSTNWQKFF